ESVVHRKVIAHAGEIFGLLLLAVLEIAIRLVADISMIADFVRDLRFVTLARHRPRTVEDEVEAVMRLVVDRYMPMDRIAFADAAFIADDRSLVRQDEIGDANVFALLARMAHRVDAHAEIRALGLELGPAVLAV